MATTVTYNGSTYSVPAEGDLGWGIGPGNLSSYLIALSTGSLQTTGGTFTLSADANFGSSFGLIAKYLTSVSVSPATAGTIRLAIGDTIDWGTGNLALSVTGTDLYWNGAKVTTGSITLPLAIASGGTGQITQQAAIDALTGSQSSGKYLRSDGTHATLSTIQAADVPTLNQNTTGTAADITATSNSSLTTLPSLTLPGSQVSGNISGNAATATLAAQATAALGIKTATTTVAVSSATAPSNGQVLTASSSTAASWTTPPPSVDTLARIIAFMALAGG